MPGVLQLVFSLGQERPLSAIARLHPLLLGWSPNVSSKWTLVQTPIIYAYTDVRTSRRFRLKRFRARRTARWLELPLLGHSVRVAEARQRPRIRRAAAAAMGSLSACRCHGMFPIGLAGTTRLSCTQCTQGRTWPAGLVRHEALGFAATPSGPLLLVSHVHWGGFTEASGCSVQRSI